MTKEIKLPLREKMCIFVCVIISLVNQPFSNSNMMLENVSRCDCEWVKPFVWVPRNKNIDFCNWKMKMSVFNVQLFYKIFLNKSDNNPSFMSDPFSCSDYLSDFLSGWNKRHVWLKVCIKVNILLKYVRWEYAEFAKINAESSCFFKLLLISNEI